MYIYIAYSKVLLYIISKVSREYTYNKPSCSIKK